MLASLRPKLPVVGVAQLFVLLLLSIGRLFRKLSLRVVVLVECRLSSLDGAKLAMREESAKRRQIHSLCSLAEPQSCSNSPSAN